MHMEPVQRYVISMSEEEAKALYEEMGMITSAFFLERPKFLELYETLEIWAGS